MGDEVHMRHALETGHEQLDNHFAQLAGTVDAAALGHRQRGHTLGEA